MLIVPDSVIKEVNKIFFDFLWDGKNDKLARNVTCIPLKEGGLGMVDIKLFFNALKSSWIPKLLNHRGKWKDYFEYHCNKIRIDLEFILRLSFVISRGSSSY